MTPAPRHRPSQYNWFNQLVAVAEGSGGATSFGYDGNGNQVSKSDGLGTTTYAYNYDNRLVGISGPGGSSYFEYDANGLRTKKADASGTRSYLLDGLSVVAEYAPDASKLAWYTQSLARIDEVLSVVNSTGKYWYETDALGSTYAMTNASGVVVSRSMYDVFGERALAAGADLGQPFGFTGREHDQGGLVYSRARFLATHSGTWNRPDPLRMLDGPNRYLYVLDAPTRRTDSAGLFATELHREITASAFGAILDVDELREAIRGASDADGPQYQLDDFRHGMRAKGVALDAGVRRWVDFIDSQVAMAVEYSQSTCADVRPWGFWHLGIGVHALEDYFSPPHRMFVMDWGSIREHSLAERHIRLQSWPAQQAVQSAREYGLLFKWLQLSSGRASYSRQGVADLAWGLYGQFLALDTAVAMDPP